MPTQAEMKAVMLQYVERVNSGDADAVSKAGIDQVSSTIADEAAILQMCGDHLGAGMTAWNQRVTRNILRLALDVKFHVSVPPLRAVATQHLLARYVSSLRWRW